MIVYCSTIIMSIQYSWTHCLEFVIFKPHFSRQSFLGPRIGSFESCLLFSWRTKYPVFYRSLSFYGTGELRCSYYHKNRPLYYWHPILSWVSSNAIFFLRSGFNELLIAIRILTRNTCLIFFTSPFSKWISELFLPFHSHSLLNLRVVKDGICESPVLIALGHAWEKGTVKVESWIWGGQSCFGEFWQRNDLYSRHDPGSWDD